MLKANCISILIGRDTETKIKAETEIEGNTIIPSEGEGVTGAAVVVTHHTLEGGKVT